MGIKGGETAMRLAIMIIMLGILWKVKISGSQQSARTERALN